MSLPSLVLLLNQMTTNQTWENRKCRLAVWASSCRSFTCQGTHRSHRYRAHWKSKNAKLVQLKVFEGILSFMWICQMIFCAFFANSTVQKWICPFPWYLQTYFWGWVCHVAELEPSPGRRVGLQGLASLAPSSPKVGALMRIPWPAGRKMIWT